MPSADYRHSLVSPASIGDAWAALQDPMTWGTLAGVTSISNAKHDTGGDLVSYDFVALAAAKSYKGKAQIVTSERPHSMAVRINSIEMDGRIGVELAEHDSGVRADVTLKLEAKGFLSNMFFLAIKTVVGASFPEQAEHLADRFIE